MVIKPPHLKSKDKVALIAPGSRPAKPSDVKRAETIVAEMGFTPVVGKHVLNTHGFMAGTDSERLADLNHAIMDDSIRAIWCLTGGYGTLPLLPSLPYQEFEQSPKIVMGAEDNSHLTLALYTRTNVVTLYGPNADSVKSKQAFETVKRSLTHVDYPELVTHDPVLEHYAFVGVEGSGKGQVLPVNLTALISLFGTEFEPTLVGRLLLIEDARERNDILDRWFTTLYISGKLSSVAALALGQLDNVDSRGASNMLSFEELVYDRVVEMGLPSCFDLPFNQTESVVPVGIWGQLEATSRGAKLTYLESVLSK
ncbi:MAG: LD-carboxypeptidase [Candidatus Obscuribacter sp.]|nr:LD-carboxypeptidase [Candidatus Obscuribacter sp.]